MLNPTASRVARFSSALILALGVLVALPAGETVKGAGRDIQNAGQAGSDVLDSAAGKK